MSDADLRILRIHSWECQDCRKATRTAVLHQTEMLSKT